MSKDSDSIEKIKELLKLDTFENKISKHIADFFKKEPNGQRLVVTDLGIIEKKVSDRIEDPANWIFVKKEPDGPDMRWQFIFKEQIGDFLVALKADGLSDLHCVDVDFAINVGYTNKEGRYYDGDPYVLNSDK